MKEINHNETSSFISSVQITLAPVKWNPRFRSINHCSCPNASVHFCSRAVFSLFGLLASWFAVKGNVAAPAYSDTLDNVVLCDDSLQKAWSIQKRFFLSFRRKDFTQPCPTPTAVENQQSVVHSRLVVQKWKCKQGLNVSVIAATSVQMSFKRDWKCGPSVP